MTIEIYILLNLISMMFIFGVIATIGWNKESRELKAQKMANKQLRHEYCLLEERLAKLTFVKDMRVLNKFQKEAKQDD